MSVAADNCQHLSTTSKEDEDEMERSEHAVEEKNEIEMDEKEEAVMEQEMDEDKADEAVQSQEDQKGDDMMESDSEEEEVEEEEGEETVNGQPLCELLANGVRREDLELDSELDKTSVIFPSGIGPDDVDRILNIVYAELDRLYQVSMFVCVCVCVEWSVCPHHSVCKCNKGIA